jgi:hypothetical protein
LTEAGVSAKIELLSPSFSLPRAKKAVVTTFTRAMKIESTQRRGGFIVACFPKKEVLSHGGEKHGERTKKSFLRR